MCCQELLFRGMKGRVTTGTVMAAVPLACVTDQWIGKHRDMRSRSTDSAQLMTPALHTSLSDSFIALCPKTMVRIVSGRTKVGQRGKMKRRQEKGTN